MSPSRLTDLAARLLAALRSLWRGAFRRDQVESDMREEMAHHIELRTADLMKQGSSRKDASRVAHMEFGHVETHRDAARRSRGLGFMDQIRFSWLDFKLAFRMLIRYPGLTVMSVLSMTAGIAFGAGFLEFTSQWARPDLSFDADHRMVGIVVDDAESLGVEARLLHDFAAWREELRSYEDLGVMRLVNRNLDMGREGSEADPGRPLSVTQISASAFRMTGAPALMGRTLIAEDEQADAPPVVLLGHDLWQDRFGGDPDVVGRTVRLGEEAATVVGVMPEGYGFPRSQSLWVPFRRRPADVQLGESPAVYVFGRLAPGASMEQAQAELDTRGLLIADARPGGGERLSARVVPYPELVYMPVPGFFDPAFVYVNLFILALVLLFCANVALLLFARAASREGELVVRNALGAGRSRIIVQLFSEALVLGGIAAVLGLFGARYGYEWFLTVVEDAEGSSFMPFWFEPRISTLTAVYAVCLTLVGAGVAGVLPALKVTRGLASRLRSQSAGGGGLGFGGVWTLIIVAQIAVTVPLPAFAFIAVNEMVTLDTSDVAFAPDEYLTARIAVERDRAGAVPRSGRDRRCRVRGALRPHAGRARATSVGGDGGDRRGVCEPHPPDLPPLASGGARRAHGRASRRRDASGGSGGRGAPVPRDHGRGGAGGESSRLGGRGVGGRGGRGGPSVRRPGPRRTKSGGRPPAVHGHRSQTTARPGRTVVRDRGNGGESRNLE